MNFQSLIGGLILLVNSVAWAQITIDNPRHLNIPEERARLLHKIIYRVVAEEFHVRAGQVEGPVTVLLGQMKQGAVADEVNGVFTIYLDHWDEAAFAMADMRLAVQRLLSQDRWERMAREIIHRVDQVTPVSAKALREKNGSAPVVPSSDQNCVLTLKESDGKEPCATVPDSQRR